MSKFVGVKTDMKAAKKLTKGAERAINSAASAAITRAGSAARTVATKSTQKKYNAVGKTINKTFKIKRLSSSSPIIELRSRQNGATPLIGFKVRKPAERTDKLKASVMKGRGGMKAIPGAFIATFGKPGIFERKTKKRQPIKELYGPPVPYMLNNEVVREDLEKRFVEVFNDRLPHEVARRLGRLI